MQCLLAACTLSCTPLLCMCHISAAIEYSSSDTQVYALPQRNRSATKDDSRLPVANWKEVFVFCESSVYCLLCVLYVDRKLLPT